MGLVARGVRALYRREAWPAPARMWLAAAGMRDFYRTLARGLAAPLARVAGEPGRAPSRGGAEALLSQLSRRMFDRRYDELRLAWPALPDRALAPRATALVMSHLYLVETDRRSGWIFAAQGGPPRGVAERVRALRMLLPLGADARWRELAVHLGELLIVLTEDLPPHLPHARRILGDICFASGARYAKRLRRFFALSEGGDAAAQAIEVLRTSEYLFRVNPKHWGATDPAARTGHLEGTACPWYDRPGWQAGHCGIFGQFQAGVCSEFGLRYNLSQTIPKHGGSTCRVDLRPLPPERLRRPKPLLAGS